MSTSRLATGEDKDLTLDELAQFVEAARKAGVPATGTFEPNCRPAARNRSSRPPSPRTSERQEHEAVVAVWAPQVPGAGSRVRVVGQRGFGHF
ncbi:hypothetical protein [Streptomyces sp. NBC_00299]|uniref:hypothetical protein n=1 Tax=Streptomyces sp. NBC_00299 TaxID=2975705 RepID=UPI002E298660|nr:hypothetical protein [Streptomyces sp. NBC_00299]